MVTGFFAILFFMWFAWAVSSYKTNPSGVYCSIYFVLTVSLLGFLGGLIITVITYMVLRVNTFLKKRGVL